MVLSVTGSVCTVGILRHHHPGPGRHLNPSASLSPEASPGLQLAQTGTAAVLLQAITRLCYSLWGLSGTSGLTVSLPNIWFLVFVLKEQ